MTDFTPIHTALTHLTTLITDTFASLVAQADKEREDLLSLLETMRETKADIHELGKICGDAGSVLMDIDERCDEIAFKVTDVIDNSSDRIPECSYLDFVEFCDECGGTIARGTNYSVNGDWYACADCLNVDTNEEVEGQMTLDIPVEA